jgi:hypothetical protein
LAARTRIVLAAAAELNKKDSAGKVCVCAASAGTWRNRFSDKRTDSVYDEPRRGAPGEIGADEIAATIHKTLETRPNGAKHCLQAIGKRSAIRPRACIASGKPSAPAAPERVRDIGGFYLSPPERALVLRVDEKSLLQAGARSHVTSPVDAAWPDRTSHARFQAARNDLFVCGARCEGRTVVGKCMRGHRTTEFRGLLDRVQRSLPIDLDTHVIIDNYGTRKTSSSAIGSPSARGGTCISERHRPYGLTKSNGSSRCRSILGSS